MTRRLGTLAAWFTAVLCVGCAPRNGTHRAAKQLYPFQREVEAKVRGPEKEREKVAALLPLRILVAHSASPDTSGMPGTVDGKEGLDAYLADVLKYIDENDLTEAVPLLERALHGDNSLYTKHVQKVAVARLWIKLKTQKMTLQEKARFLAGLLGPGQSLAVNAEASTSLAALGKPGKSAVLDLILQNKKEMGRDDARSAAYTAHLLTEPGFKPTKSEIRDLLRAESGYSKVALCIYLAKVGDKRCLDLLQQIWKKYRADHRSAACWSTIGVRTVPRIDGVAPVVLILFRKLDSEGVNAATCDARRRLLVDICSTLNDRAESPEVRKYLQGYLKRRPKRPDLLDADTFRLHHDELLCRDWARRVLEKWSKQKDK